MLIFAEMTGNSIGSITCVLIYLVQVSYSHIIHLFFVEMIENSIGPAVLLPVLFLIMSGIYFFVKESRENLENNMMVQSNIKLQEIRNDVNQRLNELAQNSKVMYDETLKMHEHQHERANKIELQLKDVKDRVDSKLDHVEKISLQVTETDKKLENTIIKLDEVDRDVTSFAAVFAYVSTPEENLKEWLSAMLALIVVIFSVVAYRSLGNNGRQKSNQNHTKDSGFGEHENWSGAENEDSWQDENVRDDWMCAGGCGSNHNVTVVKNSKITVVHMRTARHPSYTKSKKRIV